MEISIMTDKQIIDILEQRCAQELFKTGKKNFMLARYCIDMIEVLVDNMKEEEDD